MIIPSHSIALKFSLSSPIGGLRVILVVGNTIGLAAAAVGVGATAARDRHAQNDIDNDVVIANGALNGDMGARQHPVCKIGKENTNERNRIQRTYNFSHSISLVS
jgi:hypothetical protein